MLNYIKYDAKTKVLKSILLDNLSVEELKEYIFLIFIVKYLDQIRE